MDLAGVGVVQTIPTTNSYYTLLTNIEPRPGTSTFRLLSESADINLDTALSFPEVRGVTVLLMIDGTNTSKLPQKEVPRTPSHSPMIPKTHRTSDGQFRSGRT